MYASFNVLLTSISAKVPWIQAVRQALEQLRLPGLLIGADCSTPCIGSYFVDQFWQMPRLDGLTAQELLVYCKEKEVRALIPSRDGELSFFAENQDFFRRHGISVMVSPPQAVATCLDKELFWKFCVDHGLPCIPTSKALEQIDAASYVVKEQFGAGSKQIGLQLNRAEAQAWAAQLMHPVFQPYVEGREYSVDLYRNKQGAVQGTLARSRDYVVRGESQITSSVKDPDMERLCEELADKLGLYGHAVVQLFKEEGGTYTLIECNPRFGGASSLSLAMGLNSFYWFFQECLDHPLPPFERSFLEKQQVRYATDLLFNLAPATS
jgi:carbamoyl-phosphate synthase large subunit